ncbi:MAG: hypothetical protein NT107_09615 [Planctomycetota bacterium]|nr:hypothetical protein [Planctomycetota bacterium]
MPTKTLTQTEKKPKSKPATSKPTSGKPTSGKLTSGKLSSGKLSSGKLTSGKPADSKLSSGKPTSGKLSSGKLSSGKLSSGELTSGKPADSKLSSGKLSSGKLTSGKPITTKLATGVLIAGRPSKPTSVRQKPVRPIFVPRALPSVDDDDVLMAHGAGGGAGYGRCGGRMLVSKLEQTICDRLGHSGVAHSHSPRHFEVRLETGQVGAYAPMVVLRGRGREGKSVVIESTDLADSPMVRKIIAFRAQYGQEFYLIFVGTEEVLEDVPLAAYDEACAAVNVNTLIARLAE